VQPEKGVVRHRQRRVRNQERQVRRHPILARFGGKADDIIPPFLFREQRNFAPEHFAGLQLLFGGEELPFFAESRVQFGRNPHFSRNTVIVADGYSARQLLRRAEEHLPVRFHRVHADGQRRFRSIGGGAALVELERVQPDDGILRLPETETQSGGPAAALQRNIDPLPLGSGLEGFLCGLGVAVVDRVEFHPGRTVRPDCETEGVSLARLHHLKKFTASRLGKAGIHAERGRAVKRLRRIARQGEAETAGFKGTVGRPEVFHGRKKGGRAALPCRLLFRSGWFRFDGLHGNLVQINFPGPVVAPIDKKGGPGDFRLEIRGIDLKLELFPVMSPAGLDEFVVGGSTPGESGRNVFPGFRVFFVEQQPNEKVVFGSAFGFHCKLDPAGFPGFKFDRGVNIVALVAFPEEEEGILPAVDHVGDNGSRHRFFLPVRVVPSLEFLLKISIFQDIFRKQRSAAGQKQGNNHSSHHGTLQITG